MSPPQSRPPNSAYRGWTIPRWVNWPSIKWQKLPSKLWPIDRFSGWQAGRLLFPIVSERGEGAWAAGLQTSYTAFKGGGLEVGWEFTVQGKFMKY